MTKTKPFLSFEDAILLLTVRSDIKLTKREATYCFGMSKQTCADESKNGGKQYSRLVFHEFLEFIGRAAEQKFKKSELVSMPL